MRMGDAEGLRAGSLAEAFESLAGLQRQGLGLALTDEDMAELDRIGR